MYEIFSVESRKGGVGKTTIALNVAKALARKDYDVLLIDCDITGTPITKAALHSDFWEKDVVVSLHDRKPYNLIEYFENDYLRKDNSVKDIIKGLDYNKRKIHLVGSEIYGTDGKLIIDPRNLMDDLHSFWFLKMLRDLVNEFCDATSQQNKAIILDNSPGYVGIGRSVREWLTKLGPEKSTFILVSSLDEQDVESTISSAAEIRTMMQTDKEASSYVKVVVNKVPEDLISENGGYKLPESLDPKKNELTAELLPLGNNGYPKNIIKYDSAISGQFIEASLKPKMIRNEENSDLEGAIRTFDKKVANYNQKQDRYTDITSMDKFYKDMLKALSACGFVRMSKTLKGDLTPSYMLRNLNSIVNQLGSMAHPNAHILEFTRDEMKDAGMTDLLRFMEDRGLEQYSPIFVSLYNGIYKVAGFERKGANYFQMFNLNMLLAAFYAFQTEFFHRDNDYRAFLKNEIEKKNTRMFNENLLHDKTLTIVGNKQIEVDTYISFLLSSYFSKFYQAMSYTLLRMIDCSRDYDILLDACKETVRGGSKMMSEDLTRYLKEVITKKTEEPDDNKYRKLVKEPYEMKSIQNLITKFVLK